MFPKESKVSKILHYFVFLFQLFWALESGQLWLNSESKARLTIITGQEVIQEISRLLARLGNWNTIPEGDYVCVRTTMLLCLQCFPRCQSVILQQAGRKVGGHERGGQRMGKQNYSSCHPVRAADCSKVTWWNAAPFNPWSQRLLPKQFILIPLGSQGKS